ncbi:hypothetical protein P3T76_007064 [Phytophthora citrophthora]|uniref:Ubiquitin-like domain-containing protein n=1 Tax=Phytophthora citrophthora TaxID=4793 RepID=A0AAD9LLD9_9STRA|nr:hypothetical protein P3T76_007064 [Phytophthora citrophthora]
MEAMRECLQFMAEEGAAPKRVLTAAEKRAARRARVLQGGESRLQLLKGQIASIKSPATDSEPSVEQKLDEGVDELLADDEGLKEPPTELNIPSRVDPAQRRRDAAVRRRRKEQMVQEMLGNRTSTTTQETSTDQEKPKEVQETVVTPSAEPTFSRHSTALKLHSLEEKLVLLLIVLAAGYAAVCMDLRSITASLVADDQLFVSYQDLITKGVPMESIRQQFERENVGPEIRLKLEHLLSKQLKIEALEAMSSSGWFPDVADLGFFFTSLVAHPPIVLCVLVVRLLVSTGAKAVHKALDLPDVKNPQEGDLGFLANMVLSSRPALKEFLAKGRKSLDDVFVFIFALVVFVAIRAIWLIPQGTMSSPKRASLKESLAKKQAVVKPPENLKVFVATCQVVPEQSSNNNESGTSVPVNVSTPVFKQEKFPAIVLPSATMKDLQRFIMNQWVISKSSFANIPLSEHFYTFKGRILRLDGTLDAYYILGNDTIYLRFASLGKICDPWAMSTSELRVELKARDAYEINLQPEQLMQKLQNLIMKESRMRRLQQATRKEEVEQVQLITKELAPLHHQRVKKHSYLTPSEHPVERPPSLSRWPIAPCMNRTVFLSIAELERTYQLVPRDVLEPALFIFDTERKWIFDKHNTLQKQHFDYRYMCFEQDFLEMLTLKEEAGMVFWFRPQQSYEKLSAFLITIHDPAGGKNYQPLILKDTRWLTLCGENGWEGKIRRDGRKRETDRVPKFTKSISRVVTNLQSRSFDYIAVKELLYQSNPTLIFAPL